MFFGSFSIPAVSQSQSLFGNTKLKSACSLDRVLREQRPPCMQRQGEKHASVGMLPCSVDPQPMFQIRILLVVGLLASGVLVWATHLLNVRVNFVVGNVQCLGTRGGHVCHVPVQFGCGNRNQQKIRKAIKMIVEISGLVPIPGVETQNSQRRCTCPP